MVASGDSIRGPRSTGFASASAMPSASAMRRAPGSVRRWWLLPLLVAVVVGGVFVNLPRVRLPVDAVRLEVDVAGLDCGFWCPVGVDTVLRALPGLVVRSVDVHLGRVVVDHDARQVAATTILRRLGERWQLLRARVGDGPNGPWRDLPLPSPLGPWRPLAATAASVN